MGTTLGDLAQIVCAVLMIALVVSLGVYLEERYTRRKENRTPPMTSEVGWPTESIEDKPHARWETLRNHPDAQEQRAKAAEEKTMEEEK